MNLQHPLSEGAMAEVAETMRLLNSASKRIDIAQGRLEACQLQFDVKPFRTVQECLNDAFDAISGIPLANAEAEMRARGGQ